MRSGLISAVAILTILFVASTIFAIYYGVLASHTQDDLDKTVADFATIIRVTNTGEILDLKKDKEFGSAATPAMTVALDRIKALVNQISGAAGQSQAGARAEAKTRIEAAQKIVGTEPVLAQNLDDALSTVAQQLQAAKSTIETLNNQIAQDKVALQATIKQDAQANAAVQQQLMAAMADKQQAVDASQVQQKAKDDQIDAMAKNAAGERTAMQAQIDTITSKFNDQKSQMDVLKRQILALATKLGSHRVDTRQAAIDQSDGQIVKTSSNNIVYIDLGFGDHIAPGLTFEVYDGRQPLPKLPNLADDDTMPVGKGSIEVIKVDNGASECRVINTEHGQTINPGDKILNLVYDRNTKFNFVVYGDFDINNTGKAVPQDTQVIKRLVTQWGGTVTDKITPDTDFIIMGKVPEVPQFTADELKDPFNKKQQDDANAAADAYDDMAKTAQDLSVPILNQNRFLYYVGFFDLGDR